MKTVRQVFRPIQPVVKMTDDLVDYSELMPDVKLREFIYCYWRLKSLHKLRMPFNYRVIPDGCIDIFFNVDNITDTRVMGFSTAHTEFALGQTFDYVGIRFLPTAFPYIFNVDASSITDRDENFFDLVPRDAIFLAEKLEGVFAFEPMKEVLDNFFLKKIEHTRFTVDSRLSQAILEITKTHGSLSLETHIDTGISHRQLRRLFDFYVGVSPKIFSKVVRFQYFFHLLTSSEGEQHNKLFYDAGYYDQPHFNRDFKSFFGIPPSRALNG